MKRTERLIANMLRQIATRDVVVLDEAFGSPRRLAALSYVAVQYGFRYEGASRLGQTLQVRLVRDARPEARERSTAALGRLAAGRAPGMRPGTLKPLPDVAPAVALLRARIEFDALAGDVPDWRRKAVFMTASAALMALLLIPVGWRSSLAASATMAAVFALFLRREVIRKDRLARRLRSAERLFGRGRPRNTLPKRRH
ncbi:hypothetical protein ACFFS2_11100 [Streptomyces aurantiacus]|uniref:Uncharacterized protein n=1 Tax=Streptomyces aurantiacus TaxID=47760 RepID=A0A7G1NZ83_9ACTN|nr:hypothetical protein [Streptomyces aurantiacus]BCL28269.1 hypothetical protein GCM10017557_31280 [Streptomyces aurantiacus]